MEAGGASDDALMLAVGTGDQRAVGLLYERYHRDLFDYFARTVGDPTEAEDLVHETFLRVMRYGASYDRRAPFRGWLFTIARNARRAHHDRSARVRRLRESVPHEVDRPSEALRIEAASELRRVERALALMPEEPRDLLLLARVQGLSYAELETVFDCSAATLRVRVYRALKTLRALLSGEEMYHAG